MVGARLEIPFARLSKRILKNASGIIARGRPKFLQFYLALAGQFSTAFEASELDLKEGESQIGSY